MRLFFYLVFVFLCNPSYSFSKQLALTFDDAPMGNSPHFESETRTKILIKKLKNLNTPPVMIFANPCKGKDTEKTLAQLKRYTEAGHFIGNHTCSHPRLDDVGFESYAADTEKADKLLQPLFLGQKFFRFPYLNEGSDKNTRNQMRKWLAENNYKNGMVSIDNADYEFSFKVNQAKKLNKKIPYDQIKSLFTEHILDFAENYERTAVKTLGYSPKHVLLLHEMDITVLFIEELISTLEKNGWKIISIQDAFKDPLYLQTPENTFANNGILDQLVYEKTSYKPTYKWYSDLKQKLDEILDLN